MSDEIANIEKTIFELTAKLNELRKSSSGDKEITKPEKMVWHHCSTDADWNIAANPMMPDWPRILLTTVTFKEDGDKTKVRFS